MPNRLLTCLTFVVLSLSLPWHEQIPYPSPNGNGELQSSQLHSREDAGYGADEDVPALTGTRLISKGVVRAQLSATITSNPDHTKGRRGFCWNLQGDPTIEDHHKESGQGTGTFTCQLEDLNKATVYYVRPYLKLEESVIYGDQLIFTTDAFMNGVRISLKYVEGGTFQMGCTVDHAMCYGDETPVHKVHVGSYQVSIYEITTAQYSAFLNQRGVAPDGSYDGVLYLDVKDADCPIRFSGNRFVPVAGKADHPVTELTWFGAQAFCEWMGGRLPTEAEWEYAARGGSQTKNNKYSGSNQVAEVAWFQDNAGEQSQPVGKKKPNELGLFDMSGNVWEWCYDWYGLDFYDKSPSDNPKGPEAGSSKVIRGGAWNMDDWNCRISNRSSKDPGITYNYFGFRLLIPVND